MSRDTWSGIDYQPITYNRWGYANANPIMYADPSGFCSDALPGRPHICKVDGRDSGGLWSIAEQYYGKYGGGAGKKLYHENLKAWNGLKRPAGWAEGGYTVIPGEDIYLEDPALPSTIGSEQGGSVVYLEGTSAMSEAAFVNWRIDGREVLYDFSRLERTEFTYTGSGNIWEWICGKITGASTDIYNLSRSWYIGFYKFNPGKRPNPDYTGYAVNLSAGRGPENPFPWWNPLSAYSIGFDVAVNLSSNGFGATASLSNGASRNSPRLPVSLKALSVEYTYTGSTKNYNSTAEMVSDILSGYGPLGMSLQPTQERSAAIDLLNWVQVP